MNIDLWDVPFWNDEALVNKSGVLHLGLALEYRFWNLEFTIIITQTRLGLLRVKPIYNEHCK